MLQKFLASGKTLLEVLVGAATFAGGGGRAGRACDAGLEAIGARGIAIALDLAMLAEHAGEYSGVLVKVWRQ